MSLKFSLAVRLKLSRVDLVDFTKNDLEPPRRFLDFLGGRRTLFLQADFEGLILGEGNGREGVLSTVEGPGTRETEREE